MRKNIKRFKNLTEWMDENEYTSFNQMRGSMSYSNLSDPSHLERLNYMKTIKAFL